MAEDEWEEQTGADLWLPAKEKEELVGEILDEQEGSYGVQYTIKKEDGEEVRTPSHKVLQNRMSRVNVGDTVKIVFTGEEPAKVKGQSPMKMYDVFIKRA